MKALIFSDNPDGTMWSCDTIEYKGMMWLVPLWINFEKEKIRKPARIVRLDGFQHEAVKFGESDFVVNEAVPSALFEIQTPRYVPAQFVVLEAPDISVPLNRTA